MGILYDKVKKKSVIGGTLGTGSLYERASMNAGAQPKVSTPVAEPEVETPGFISRTLGNVKALATGEVRVRDVVKEMPRSTVKVVDAVAETVAPAITNFFKKTGSVFGEGMAYALDPTVRQQYTEGSAGLRAMQDKTIKLIHEKRARGEDVTELVKTLNEVSQNVPDNLDILPTVTSTTPLKMVKYTFAAGLETAILRSIPGVAKMKIFPRFGVGALEGMGFAITEGLAHDKSAEEIIDSMPEYGVMGGAASTLAPYLLPLLKSETARLPKEFKAMFKGLQREIKEKTGPGIRKLTVASDDVERQVMLDKEKRLNVKSEVPEPVKVPVSTPKSRYADYLRSQGYEPYVPPSRLGTIEMGPKPKSKIPTIEMGDEAGLPKREGFEYVPEEPPKTQSLLEDEIPVPKTEKPRLVPEKKAIGTRTETELVPEKNIEVESPETPRIQEEAISQEKRTTSVPRDNLPVSSEEGATRVSRLEARMNGVVNDVNTSRAEANGISTYKQMNKAEVKRKSAEYVEKNADEAMEVLKGNKPAPEGLLHNSIALALEKKAELTGDAALARKLASLRSTRAGQEISFLTEVEPDNPISAMNEIIKARQGRAQRLSKGKEITAVSREEAIKAATEMKSKRLKIEEAESLLSKLLC